MRFYISTIPIALVAGEDPVPDGTKLIGATLPQDDETADLTVREVRELIAAGSIVPADGELCGKQGSVIIDEAAGFATGPIAAGELLTSDPVTVIINGRTLDTYPGAAEALAAAVAEAERLDGEARAAETERDQAKEAMERLGDDIAALQLEIAAYAEASDAGDAAADDVLAVPAKAKAEDTHAAPAKPAKAAKRG